MPSCIFDSKINSSRDVMNFVFSFIDDNNLTAKNKTKISIIIDEIYSNIVKYAYLNEHGEIKIDVNIENNCVILVFVDDGPQYNPLTNKTESVFDNLDKRRPGGLGIFITKKIRKKNNKTEHYY